MERLENCYYPITRTLQEKGLNPAVRLLSSAVGMSEVQARREHLPLIDPTKQAIMAVRAA